MDLELEVTVLTLVSTVAFLAGIVLVLLYGPTLTMVGVLLIIGSTVVFLLDLADVVGHWGKLTGE